MPAAPSAPEVDPVFVEFCEAGLWPGIGPARAQQLTEAGITAPARITARRLAELRGVGLRQAERLVSAWIGAEPAYDVLRMLHEARLQPRWAGRAVEILGDGAEGGRRAYPGRMLPAVDVARRHARRS
ncbi:MAG: helix-hairpin-helix domain-containing protein, partial [Mycobacteriales bacterium]